MKVLISIFLIIITISPATSYSAIRVSPEPNIFDDINIISLNKPLILIENKLIEAGLSDRIKISIRGNRKGIRLKQESDFYAMSIEELDINRNSRSFKAMMSFSGEDFSELVQINGRYEEIVTVPALATTIPQNTIIEGSHIEWMDTKKHLLKHDTIIDDNDLIGKKTKRSIPAMRPIRMMSIDNPALVFRNETVNFTYKTSYIEVRTVGIALEDGSMGQIIKIKNPESKKIVKGMVTDRKVVKAL